MPILSSIFSIGAPRTQVDYSPVLKLLDDINLRRDKQRELDQKYRSDANEIALKFGAQINGLPNDIDNTREKFVTMYNNFKNQYDAFSNAGRSADFFGSIQYMDAVNELQKINSENYKNIQRENQWKEVTNEIQKNDNGYNLSYQAFFDIANGTSSVIKRPKKNYTAESLTLNGLSDMYSIDRDYSGTSLAALQSESQSDYKKVINFWGGLLGIVGQVQDTDYAEKLKEYVQAYEDISLQDKNKIYDFIVTSTNTNRLNLNDWEDAINNGTLMSTDMAKSLKGAILQNYMKNTYGDAYNKQNLLLDKDKISKALEFVDNSYKNNLAKNVQEIANIYLKESENQDMLSGIGGKGAGAEQTQQSVSALENYLTSATDMAITSTPTIFNTPNLSDGEQYRSYSSPTITPELNKTFKGATSSASFNIKLTESYSTEDGLPDFSKGVYYNVSAPNDLSALKQYLTSTGRTMEDVFDDDVIKNLNEYNYVADNYYEISQLNPGVSITDNDNGEKEYWNNASAVMNDRMLAAVILGNTWHYLPDDEYVSEDGTNKNYGYRAFMELTKYDSNRSASTGTFDFAIPGVDNVGIKYLEVVKNLHANKKINDNTYKTLVSQVHNTQTFLTIANDKAKYDEYIRTLSEGLAKAMPKATYPVWTSYTKYGKGKITMDILRQMTNTRPLTADENNNQYATPIEFNLRSSSTTTYPTVTSKKQASK